MRFPLKAQYRLAVLWGFILLAFLPAILTLTLPGCATKGFDPAGPYATNAFLGRMDITLAESKTSLIEFVAWEYTNHTELVKSKPGVAIAKAANSIRSNSPLWFTNAYNLRAVYVSVFTPQSSNDLLSAVTALQANSLSISVLTNSFR